MPALKTFCLITIFCSWCVFLLPTSSRGQQWEKVPVEVNDTFRDIFGRNDTVFVLTNQSGLWYSSNNGQSWQKSLLPENLNLYTLYGGRFFFTADRCLYTVGKSDQRGRFNYMFHSTNGTTGAWAESTEIAPDEKDLLLRFLLRYLTISTLSGIGNTIVGYGFNFPPVSNPMISYEILSNDLGKTWRFTPIDSGSTSQFNVFNPSLAILKNVMYRTRNKFLESSRDSAKTWQRFGRGDSIIRSTIQNIAPMDSVILAITTTGTYRLGRDSVWRESNKEISISTVFCFHSATHRLYTVNQNDLLYSSDAGITWQRRTIPANTTFTKLVATAKGVVGLARDNTLWLSLNDGLSWQSIHQNLVSQPIEQVLSAGENIVIAAGKSGVLIAKDSSRLLFSPIPLSSPTIFQTRQLLRYTKDGVAAILYYYYPGTSLSSPPTIYQSIFYTLPNGYSQQDFSCCNPRIPPVLGLWGTYRAWMYNDAEFPAFFRGSPTNINSFAMQGLETVQPRYSLLLHTPRELIVGTETGVHRSVDSGRSWQRTGLQRPTYILATLGTTTLAGTNDGIFSSSDSGQTWQQQGLRGISVHQIATLPPNTILTGSTTGGVFLSQNGGVSWQEFTQGLPIQTTSSISLSDKGIGFAVSKGELYTTNRTLVSVREQEQPVSSLGMSVSVSPNPSNDRATCLYTLAEAGVVKVTMQTISGQVLRTIFVGLRGAGEHETEIETSLFAQGTYMIVVQTPRSQVAQKIVIVR